MLYKTDEEKELEKNIENAHCAIVNTMVSVRNGLRNIELAKANPAYNTYLYFTKEDKDKLDEVENALKSIAFQDYDYLKDVTKTPKDKGKLK